VSGVEAPAGVKEKGKATGRRVTRPVIVQERLVATRCIVAAGCLVIERVSTGGRVELAGGVVDKRKELRGEVCVDKTSLSVPPDWFNCTTAESERGKRLSGEVLCRIQTLVSRILANVSPAG
jgi:hypothetical protein